jgi:hypothetical protein
MFFVATAPLADDGLLNLSPKGLPTFVQLGTRKVLYLDLTGSGAETIAHLRENGRIVLMFCDRRDPRGPNRLTLTTPIRTARRSSRASAPNSAGDRPSKRVEPAW